MSEDTYITAGNTTDGPLVVSEAGRTIAGHSLGTVNPSRQPAKGLLEDGYLVEVEARDDEDVSDEARAAFEATKARNAGDTADEVAAASTAAEVEAATPDDEPADTPTTTGRATRRTR